MSDRGKAEFTTMDFSDGVMKNVESNDIHAPSAVNIMDKGFEDLDDSLVVKGVAGRALTGAAIGSLVGSKTKKREDEAGGATRGAALGAALGAASGLGGKALLRANAKKIYPGIKHASEAPSEFDAMQRVASGIGTVAGGTIGGLYGRKSRSKEQTKEISSEITIKGKEVSPSSPDAKPAAGSPYKHSFEYGAERIAEEMHIPIENARKVRASQYRKHGVEPNSLKVEKGLSKRAAWGIGAGLGTIGVGGYSLNKKKKQNPDKTTGQIVRSKLAENKVMYPDTEYDPSIKSLDESMAVEKGLMDVVKRVVKKPIIRPNVVPDDLKAGIDRVSKYNRLKTAEGYTGAGPAPGTIMAKRQAEGGHMLNSASRPGAEAARGPTVPQKPMSIEFGGRRPNSYDQKIKEIDESLVVEKGLMSPAERKLVQSGRRAIDARFNTADLAEKFKKTDPVKADKYQQASEKMVDRLKNTHKKIDNYYGLEKRSKAMKPIDPISFFKKIGKPEWAESFPKAMENWEKTRTPVQQELFETPKRKKTKSTQLKLELNKAKEVDNSLIVEKGMSKDVRKILNAGSKVSELAMKNRMTLPERAEKYDKAAQKLFGRAKELRDDISLGNKGIDKDLIASKSFKAVQNKIEGEGYTHEQAGAILASKTRKASAAAKAKNPNLKKVPGA